MYYSTVSTFSTKNKKFKKMQIKFCDFYLKIL